LEDTKAGNPFDYFLCDTAQGTPSCKVEDVADFVKGASLEDVTAGVGPAGSRRTSWIYDKSSEEGEPKNGVTAAKGLHRRLSRPV